jgi:hypothetical protein
MQRGAMEQAAAIARMTDGSRTAELVASDGTMMAEIVVTADGRGFVSPSELPTLPAGRTYQLWAMSDDWPETPAVSVGVLGRDPSVFAFQADGGVAGFAITEERAPGVERTRQAEKFEGWLA